MSGSTRHPTPTAAAAHILLAEDDLVSARFLGRILTDLGCRVTQVRSGDSALRYACEICFDLLVLDCRMPGGGAATVLKRLRRTPAAASRTAPALATSAELAPTLRSELRRAGFAAALAKPITATALRTAISQLLPDLLSGSTREAWLDDAAALSRSGAPSAVATLRGLFAVELEQLLADLDELAQRPPALAQHLHRLIASCGFCGASALARGSGELKHLLDTAATVDNGQINGFRALLEATLAALHDRAPRAEPART